MNYLLAYLVNRRNKIIFLINIIFDVCFLLFYKYIGIIGKIAYCTLNINFQYNISMPIAISFYTFSQISLIVDIYNNKVKKLSLVDYMCYMLFFPKILQGPIVSYNYFIEQLNGNNKINWNNMKNGCIDFILGISKKVLLADIFGKAANYGFSNIGSLDCFNTIIVMISYTLQLYFDFSGYSDMASGVSLMLNIELPNNFEYPYSSTNISDFWKKWHISLTSFLKKYIYIPLGGNRKGAFRTLTNTLIVFAISGIWHGSRINYLLWGILNGLIMIIYKTFSKYFDNIPKILQWLINFSLINILWSLFKSSSVLDWINIISRLFIIKPLEIMSGLQECFDFTAFGFVSEKLVIRMFKTSRYYVIIYILFGIIVSVFGNKIKNKIFAKIGLKELLLLAFLFVYSLLSMTSMSSFVYAGF